MQTKYLFPNRFQKIGWILLIPGLFMGIFELSTNSDHSSDFYDHFLMSFPVIWSTWVWKESYFFEWGWVNIYNAIVGTLLILGSLFVAFAKQKVEDEFIAKIRLESLVWATYVNYIILLIAFLFIYGLPFVNVMMFNMFTILFLFIIRFNWELLKMKKASKNEE